MNDHDVIIALVAFDALLMILFVVVAVALSRITARLPR